jgi:hypothetical protein
MLMSDYKAALAALKEEGVMMITPQARRRIAGAVRALPVGAQDRWGAWAQQYRTDIPYEIAVIALEALVTAESMIEQQLGQKTLDEDAEADLLNDLGYIQAIETALRNEGIGR